MVELRKRKAPAQPLVAERKRKKVQAPTASAQKGNYNPKTAISETTPKVGDVINLDQFGGDIETNDGQKITLQDLVDSSKAGVVLFTYPRASTPGCTKQACLFRDHYDTLSESGLSIYGLSTDSPKANTTFKTKQGLPYPLLCNPSSSLIEAIGLKKLPKGTIRGVFVLDKVGKVLVLQAGGPDATVNAVQKLVSKLKEQNPDPATVRVSSPAEDEH
ncbi:AhpC-TSA-domain-containing protein [Aspergillus sclerotioniger CBS 115572]|uniref:thioredoxin-dependent peroxiredoxin n=1 Tax=Aspergillus sclerotioniger CBS 115572 TaxID=1450535 RepID=A0A317X8D4_9EURO|nr:AhpC-TSA-domain-containing protein [Aspergillus sclerotioniger CBS 115572]PWY93837.1 AhpC-TSA-domain-containing protein [Aspergillus sclerotioniger CBS 115572]